MSARGARGTDPSAAHERRASALRPREAVGRRLPEACPPSDPETQAYWNREVANKSPFWRASQPTSSPRALLSS
eukprot:12673577-Alexandrium_andersonii.AAC.1